MKLNAGKSKYKARFYMGKKLITISNNPHNKNRVKPRPEVIDVHHTLLIYHS